MGTRAAIGAMVMGAAALGGCWVPVEQPSEPRAVLELTVTPFPASNPCALGCDARTTVWVENTGDLPTATGVVVTVDADAPSTGIILDNGEPDQRCSSTNVLDPDETCSVLLYVTRPVIPADGGALLNDPGPASGLVTATSGSDFENQTYSVTLGP